jgi:hypothetical protein
VQAGVWYEAQHQLRVARRKRRAAEASTRSHHRHSAEASFMEWGRWWWLPVLTSSVASAGAVALSYPLTSLRCVCGVCGTCSVSVVLCLMR